MWWLAVAGLPVFHQPLPESPLEPAAFSVASGRADLRTPCYGLVCPASEWDGPSRYVRLQRRTAPGLVKPVEGLPAPTIASGHHPMHAPASRRDWHATHADTTRVSALMGYEPIRRPGTNVRVEMGTGYRIEPYADWGTAVPGLIARGNLLVSHGLGERVQLTQQVQVETGRENTMLRQTVGLDLQLKPQWMLQTSFELRHDTFANNGDGATDTEGAMRLRYEF